MLFQQPGVKRVFLAEDYVTVTKDEEYDWDDIRTIIIGTINEFFATYAPCIVEDDVVADTGRNDYCSIDVRSLAAIRFPICY